MMALYFAYGSNMETVQLKSRCPAVSLVARATLQGHRLIYRGPSKNRGLGVLSIDPAPAHHVPGLVFSLSEAELDTLDGFEGAPQWYLRIEVRPVLETGEQICAQTYRLPEHVRVMPPTDAYRKQVERAYQSLGLDPEILARAHRLAAG